MSSRTNRFHDIDDATRYNAAGIATTDAILSDSLSPEEKYGIINRGTRIAAPRWRGTRRSMYLSDEGPREFHNGRRRTERQQGSSNAPDRLKTPRQFSNSRKGPSRSRRTQSFWPSRPRKSDQAQIYEGNEEAALPHGAYRDYERHAQGYRGYQGSSSYEGGSYEGGTGEYYGEHYGISEDYDQPYVSRSARASKEDEEYYLNDKNELFPRREPRARRLRSARASSANRRSVRNRIESEPHPVEKNRGHLHSGTRSYRTSRYASERRASRNAHLESELHERSNYSGNGNSHASRRVRTHTPTSHRIRRRGE